MNTKTKDTTSSPLVCLIVLHFNTGELLLKCLKSLLDIEYQNLKILLVDNASSDGFAQIASQQFKNIEVLWMKTNKGYCGGNNSGLRWALNAGAEYVLVLNPDTVVCSTVFVSQLVEFLQKNSKVGVAGPIVFYRHVDDRQNTLCRYPFLMRKIESFAAIRNRNASNSKTMDGARRAEVLNGVCVCLRASMLRAVGLYDEKIFMYGEDWDLTYRAESMGWESWQVSVPSVIHKQKSDGYDFLSMTNFLLKRNAVFFLRKHGRYFEAIFVAAGGLLVSFYRVYSLGIRQRRGVRAYWRFFSRLLLAYIMVFFGRIESPSFGPPNVTWSPIE